MCSVNVMATCLTLPQTLIWGFEEAESFSWGNETSPKKKKNNNVHWVLKAAHYWLLLAITLLANTDTKQQCVILMRALHGTILYTLIPYVYLAIIIIAIHVDICCLAQLQGHSLLWLNLIIPIKTVFLLSVITVIWQKSSPLILHSDTVFM